ncbi:MAG: GspE/PulE family protein [bacterium]
MSQDEQQSIEDLFEPPKAKADEDSTTGKFQKKIKEINVKDLEQETEKLAQKLQVGYINLVGFPVTAESLELIPEAEAKELKSLCFYVDTDHLRLASMQPDQSQIKAKLEELKKQTHVADAEMYLISEHGFNYALELYKNLPKLKPIPPGVEITGADLERLKKEIDNLQSLRDKINEVSISDVVTLVIATALKIGSSDIHIEAGEKEIEVRLRVDGELQAAAAIDKKRWDQIISRMKALAKVKINISDKPQDGRYTIYLDDDKKIDVRASFLPTSYGESLVMRLLKSDVTGLDITALGLRDRELQILQRELDKPNGMILTVGPTGSGKTTTLYAGLKKLNQPGTKIITVEDPVEYSLEGVNQSQVDESRGYTFAKALRSILRQDPDIIMIGEIRDLETAEIAIQSSLTGHLVLSTLHTNDAAGVIPRLLDLGVKPFLLTPSINAIIGQRLVRKLCPNCRVEHKLTEAEDEKVKKILAIISPKSNIDIPAVLPTIYQAGPGCDQCSGIGYKDRLGVFEIMTMTNAIKEATEKGLSAFKIMELAIDEGMVTMLQEGVLKAMDGLTSLDEVYRVMGKMEYVDELYEIATSKTLGRGLHLTADNVKIGEDIAADFINSKGLISNYKTSEIINILLACAIKTEASDIHIDPIEQGVEIRVRIDGMLHDVAALAKEHYVPLMNEVKQLSNFPTNIKQPTYDRRFSIYLPNKTRMDCRVSIISGGYGEAAVLRILSQQPQTLHMEELGIRFQTLDIINDAINQNKGIVINTGPTGSGKTTTLYSILNQLNKKDVKIITLEDPIEYSLGGVMQTQIDKEGGYTFANALKSLMRQNPNIIMIGEIRDAETAQTALEAALTGHLVLSTVHANSAAGAMVRLAELGIDRSVLANALNCSIGQRLVRRLCPACKKEQQPDEALMQKVKTVLDKIDPSAKITLPDKFTFFASVGCPACGGIGYKGRLGLFEAIPANNEVRKLIQDTKALDAEIETLAAKAGFISIELDGILKALSGDTSLEEVFRVTK